MARQFEYYFNKSLKQLERQIKLAPMNLGGVSGATGGVGGPPGGFTGMLTQTRVAYDTTEAETDYTPASGASILDNLNHIRGRIADVESKTQQGAFTVVGSLEVGTNPLKMVNHYGVTKTISGVYLDIDVPPSGADIIVDLDNDGVTIFTDQDHRPRILDGESSGFSINIDESTWVVGEALKAAIDQVGSGVAGSDLTITVVYY